MEKQLRDIAVNLRIIGYLLFVIIVIMWFMSGMHRSAIDTMLGLHSGLNGISQAIRDK